jgi:hypothetical protein
MPISEKDPHEHTVTTSGPDWIGAVLTFLNAVLTEEEIKQAAEIDGGGDQSWCPRCIRGRIADLINTTFRLQWRECPLRSELARFRLYHRDDMADALAVAYSNSLRGGDPLDALRADYCVGRLRDYRQLFPADLDDVRQRARNKESSASYIWADCGRFVEEGDRLVKYHTGTRDGVLLVRGDRLVWDTELTRYCVMGRSRRKEAAEAEFKRRGGSAAFLAGEFEWPDPSWINPVSESDDSVPFSKLQLKPIS